MEGTDTEDIFLAILISHKEADGKPRLLHPSLQKERL